ncbi:MAG TPA: EpsI family protein [Candidatus Acidoferrales bacterium]|nr:EpsI family protein [Candidatus Acidoferrales bacterium]
MTSSRNKYVRILSIVLVLQGVAFYAVAMRPERIPPVGPLDLFPSEFPGWVAGRDIKIEPEVQDILKADDLLSREYVNTAASEGAYLFIAFFRTQREGQAPHSPKNCLPGAGFEPIESFPITVQFPGRDEPAKINRYLTARGDEKSITLYWYQSHSRIIADEFAAKFWLIADSVKYRRSDTALVKIVVPVRNNDAASATNTAVSFAQVMFPALVRQLPM